MAAMECKIESFEKEIKRLQKALEKSDKYIAELEAIKDLTNGKENETSFPKPEPISNVSSFNFIKPNSSNEEILEQKPLLNDPPSAKKNIISKNNFYGSPSKTPTRQTHVTQSSIPNISSFGERLKKNLFNTPAPAFSSNLNLVSNNSSLIISSSQSAVESSSNQIASQNSLLFSPMKRLRLEENSNQMIQNLNNHEAVLPISNTNSFQSTEQNDLPSSSSFLNTVSIINQSMQLIEDQMIQHVNTNI